MSTLALQDQGLEGSGTDPSVRPRMSTCEGLGQWPTEMCSRNLSAGSQSARLVDGVCGG